MSTIKFDAKAQAIMIMSFEESDEKMRRRTIQLQEKLANMPSFQSANKARLMAQLESLKDSVTKVLKEQEQIREVLEAKRKYLVATEGSDIFAGIGAAEIASISVGADTTGKSKYVI